MASARLRGCRYCTQRGRDWIAWQLQRGALVTCSVELEEGKARHFNLPPWARPALVAHARVPMPVPVHARACPCACVQAEELEKACEACGAANVRHSMTHALARAPRVLVVHLKRFNLTAEQAAQVRARGAGLAGRLHQSHAEPQVNANAHGRGCLHGLDQHARRSLPGRVCACSQIGSHAVPPCPHHCHACPTNTPTALPDRTRCPTPLAPQRMTRRRAAHPHTSTPSCTRLWR